MASGKKYKGILAFTKQFPDEKSCLVYIAKKRWGSKPVCPHCNHKKCYTFSDGKRYKCAKCRKQFTATVGTMFEGSKIALRSWLLAVHLASSRKKGISSPQLAREIGVTQKTAWFMLHRIRKTMEVTAPEMLEGVVEADETYIGGKSKWKHYDKRKKGTQGRSTLEKTPVFGVMQRDGKIITKKVPDTKRKTIRPIVYENVESGSAIMTDEWFAYRGLDIVYDHSMVNHGRYQYVDGDCHTNNIECAWSHLKRAITGTHHWASHKHLDRYLDEFDFRYNTRDLLDDERFNIALSHLNNSRLSYKELTK